MNLIPGIKLSGEKKLVGKSLTMSLSDNQTGKLWKSFMPLRNAIANKLSSDLISMTIYSPDYFIDFNPSNELEKWAAIEVSEFKQVPTDMKSFILPDGLYAVFDYTGKGNDAGIYEYIFRKWLPNSKYMLDNRPHFEVLGEKYKQEDPASEEEIWIPIIGK